MPVGGIAVPEALTTALTAQSGALTTTLGNWLPAILIGTIAIPVVVGFFGFITRKVRGGLRVR